MADVTLMPNQAADLICHDEQMVVWSGEIVGALSMAGFFRDDIDYSENIELHEIVTREIRDIIGAALDHPEARTVISKRPLGFKR